MESTTSELTTTANGDIGHADADDAERLGFDRVGYLFGHPIVHSMSPLLHQTVYAALGLNWAQLPLDSTDIPAFLARARRLSFYGASVTMPHKVAILRHLDALAPEAAAVGAANTVFVRTDPATGARTLVGTNTDVIGVRDALRHNGANLAGRPTLVLGGGGAARSAVYALRILLGAADIYIVNRDADEAAAVIAECAARGLGDGITYIDDPACVPALAPPAAIVACVPDLAPATEAERRARAVLDAFLASKHKGILLEMCYHPTPWTAIARAAEDAGWQVVLGTEAMIYQGLEQDRYWTGRPVEELPLDAVRKVVATELANAMHPSA
ncbi:quinate dehydrogenase [Vararia minispora EC-137]|uniref:Quinate dehydrogenase n=1 Tax=Vararia minispora EC-137 TaxID=1314806 RepID=A0ACB8QIW2_9AGAM|nr:quinate dehydrogenase [Vararia minispora EC-137]